MKSYSGYFLAASPYMTHSDFARTVVLLMQHNEDGAVGVVLNRQSDETVASLWEKLTQHPCVSNRHVNLGGPVSGPLMALHMEQPLAEAMVPPGVFLAANKEHLEQLVEQSREPFRLFVGHAGWETGQLEHELSRGAWLTTPATEELIFEDRDDLWRDVLKRVGRSVLESAGIKDFPEDVTVN